MVQHQHQAMRWNNSSGCEKKNYSNNNIKNIQQFFRLKFKVKKKRRNNCDPTGYWNNKMAILECNKIKQNECKRERERE